MAAPVAAAAAAKLKKVMATKAAVTTIGLALGNPISLVTLMAFLLIFCVLGACLGIGFITATKKPEPVSCDTAFTDAAYNPDGQAIEIKMNVPPPSVTAFDKYNTIQMRNAWMIIDVGKQRKIPRPGWEIAVAVAMIESYDMNRLANPEVPESYTYNYDKSTFSTTHDGEPRPGSWVLTHHTKVVGAFQQKAPWGSIEERMDTRTAANAFYGGIGGPQGLVDVSNWLTKDPGVVAQDVQVSDKGFEGHVRNKIPAARKVIDHLEGAPAGQPAQPGNGGMFDFANCAPSGPGESHPGSCWYPTRITPTTLDVCGRIYHQFYENAVGYPVITRDNWEGNCIRDGVGRPGSEHPLGRACDFMTNLRGAVSSGPDKARGDAIAAWAIQNAEQLGICYVIWEQRIWGQYRPKWIPMADEGNNTENHFDHVHISFETEGWQGRGPAGDCGYSAPQSQPRNPVAA